MSKKPKARPKTIPPKFILELDRRMNDILGLMKHFATVIFLLREKGFITDEEIEATHNKIVEQNKHSEDSAECDIQSEHRPNDEIDNGPERSKIFSNESNGDDSNIINISDHIKSTDNDGDTTLSGSEGDSE